MKIKTITSQHRRDFFAIYECEHCGYTHTGFGYDDSNFHNNVIPAMKCPNYNKSADAFYRPLAPRHPDDQTV